MPKHEFEPITDDEWLLRRVRKERFRLGRTPVIALSTFEPRLKGREPDVDGLSLFRAACFNDPADLLSVVPEDRRTGEGIVRIPVSLVRGLGLTIESKPMPSIPGHVVLRELNASAMASRVGWLPIAVRQLTNVASEPENILVWPADV